MADENVEQGQEQQEQLSTEEQVDRHNAAMLQRQIDAGRFKLPEQFKTADEFLKSYKNLQSHATKATTENARLREQLAVQDAGTPPEKKEAPVDDLGKELLQPANADVQKDGKVDWAAVDAELAKDNDLSAGTKKALVDAGIPQAMVDARVRDHKAQIARGAAEAATLVGGQDQLKAILAWGRANLPEADQQQLADQLRGPGWKLALLGLRSLRDAAEGTAGKNEPRDITGAPGGPAKGQVQPFATRGEMRAAMTDPKYGRDKEYTEHVMARVIASQGQLVNARLVDKQTRRFGKVK